MFLAPPYFFNDFLHIKLFILLLDNFPRGGKRRVFTTWFMDEPITLQLSNQKHFKGNYTRSLIIGVATHLADYHTHGHAQLYMEFSCKKKKNLREIDWYWFYPPHKMAKG